MFDELVKKEPDTIHCTEEKPPLNQILKIDLDDPKSGHLRIPKKNKRPADVMLASGYTSKINLHPFGRNVIIVIIIIIIIIIIQIILIIIIIITLIILMTVVHRSDDNCPHVFGPFLTWVQRWLFRLMADRQTQVPLSLMARKLFRMVRISDWHLINSFVHVLQLHQLTSSQSCLASCVVRVPQPSPSIARSCRCWTSHSYIVLVIIIKI